MKLSKGKLSLKLTCQETIQANYTIEAPDFDFLNKKGGQVEIHPNNTPSVIYHPLPFLPQKVASGTVKIKFFSLKSQSSPNKVQIRNAVKNEILINLICDIDPPTIGFKPGYLQAKVVRQSHGKIHCKFNRSGWQDANVKARIIVGKTVVTEKPVQPIIIFKKNQNNDDCYIPLSRNAILKDVDSDEANLKLRVDILDGDHFPKPCEKHGAVDIPVKLDVGLTLIRFEGIQQVVKRTGKVVRVPLIKEEFGNRWPCQVFYRNYKKTV